jgi:hypothetical protein
LERAVEGYLLQKAEGKVAVSRVPNAEHPSTGSGQALGHPDKTLDQMFGPEGNPATANLFKIIACLQEHEGVRLQVVA